MPTTSSLSGPRATRTNGMLLADRLEPAYPRRTLLEAQRLHAMRAACTFPHARHHYIWGSIDRLQGRRERCVTRRVGIDVDAEVRDGNFALYGVSVPLIVCMGRACQQRRNGESASAQQQKLQYVIESVHDTAL